MGFTPGAVDAVLGRGDAAGVERALERLEAFSLVRRMQTEGHYDLHCLLRHYARAPAERAEGQRQWAKRHTPYFLALAGWGYNQLNDLETDVQAIVIVMVERANFMTAQDTCLAQGLWGVVIGFAYRLNRLFARTGHWRDQQGALEAGIENQSGSALAHLGTAVNCQHFQRITHPRTVLEARESRPRDRTLD